MDGGLAWINSSILESGGSGIETRMFSDLRS